MDAFNDLFLTCLDNHAHIKTLKLKQQVAEDLESIAGWCCANHLLINPDKTKLVLSGTRQLALKLPDYSLSRPPKTWVLPWTLT